MKRITYIITTLAVLAACNKNFDPKIYGVLTEQNFPGSESDLESLVMSCYIPYTNTWTY